MIAVADTGIGMRAEVVARVFDPFYTTKPVGQGTGLGLSQVHGFIKQSGGHVAIYTEPDKGTTVKLYLPRHHGVGTVEAEPKQDPALLPRAQKGEVVLVVEDESGVRKLTIDMLEELGYTTREAADAQAALALLETDPDIDLLFTDVVLPGMNGRQLASEAQRRNPSVAVLFTTGYTRNAIVHHGILDPDVQVILKPYTIEALAQKVSEVLRKPA
jgi:CheY-like chemotaxis protein